MNKRHRDVIANLTGLMVPMYSLEPNTLLFEGEPQVYDPNTAWPHGRRIY